MAFGIPNEDFHGGFGLPHDEFVEAYQNYMNKYKADDDLTDEECDELAQESSDNLVRSCIEAGGEIRELRRLLTIAKDDLLYLLIDDKGYRQELKVEQDLKEISEYLERLKNE